MKDWVFVYNGIPTRSEIGTYQSVYESVAASVPKHRKTRRQKATTLVLRYGRYLITAIRFVIL